MTHSTATQPNNYSFVVENYNRICYNINNIKAKYRNASDNIEIMAVTKTVEPEIINTAIACGINLLGENRVQEFMSKKDEYNKNAKVHFIGALQTNKVKYIINEVSNIQSVDSFKLAQEIDKQALKNNIVMDILLEINIGNEQSKSGINKDDLEQLVYSLSELNNINVKGLMSIPPISADEHLYDSMNSLFNEYKGKNIKNLNMEILSMGMSNDYEIAIKHGSNLVRIGTGLFGARKYIGGM